MRDMSTIRNPLGTPLHLDLNIYGMYGIDQKHYIGQMSAMLNYCSGKVSIKTSQELRMLSSVTLNCQVTKIVMDSGSQF